MLLLTIPLFPSCSSKSPHPFTPIDADTLRLPENLNFPTIVLFSSMSCMIYSPPPGTLNISTRLQVLLATSFGEAAGGYNTAISFIV